MSEPRPEFNRPWGGDRGTVGGQLERGHLVGASDGGWSSRGQIEWPEAEPALGRADALMSGARSRRTDETSTGTVEAHDAGVELIGADELARGDDRSGTPTDDPVVVDEAVATDAVATDGDASSAPTERSTRATNPLVAELMKAMHGAAESARGASLASVSEDAKTRIEAIHATSSEEATALRAAADAEINEIRAWSKAELARIREETDARIAGRRDRLASEMDEHAAAVERRIEQVQAAVADFQERMADFFTMLLAETDPARVATLAERLPEPPQMDQIGDGPGIAASSGAAADDAPAGDARAGAVEIGVATDEPEAVVEDPVVEDAPEATPDGSDRLSAEGARAAEAAAAEAIGDAASGDEADAAGAPDTTVDQSGELSAEDAVAARLARLVPGTPVGPSTQTHVIVRGLATVGSIAGFKRAIARLEGVASVNVSSGPGGEFVFLTSHAPTADLATAIAGFAGYDAKVSLEADGTLAVTAHDRDAVG